MGRIILTFGLIAGGILSLMMLLTIPFIDQIGPDKGEILGYSSMVAAFLLIFFGVRSYRDNIGGGKVTFGRAFGVGMLIVLVASLCYDLTWQVMYSRMGPEFMDKMVSHQIEKARASNKSEAEIDKQIADIQKYSALYANNRLVNFAITLLEPLPVGLVIALVSAGILSRKRREAVPQQALA